MGELFYRKLAKETILRKRGNSSMEEIYFNKLFEQFVLEKGVKTLKSIQALLK